jgi:anti-sigma B factor antagonist
MAHVNGTAIVNVVGAVDMSTVPKLHEALELMAEAGQRDIIVDMAGLTFLDSSGVSALVRAFKQSRAAGKSLVLTNVPPQAWRALDMGGLSQIVRSGTTVRPAD